MKRIYACILIVAALLGGIPLQQWTGAGLCTGYLSRLGLRP